MGMARVDWVGTAGPQVGIDLPELALIFESIAVLRRMKLLGAVRDESPALRLRKRVGLRTFELSLQLEPESSNEPIRHYSLYLRWFYDFGEILTRLLEHRLLRRYTSDELRAGTLKG
jgi:hypothetical protein